MWPLIVETAGVDPLILLLVSMMAGGAGFAARYWIKERDSERTQLRNDIDAERARMQAEIDAERAKNTELTKALDGYRDRTPELIALLGQLMAHTDDTARADPPPQPNRARIRPRERVQ